MSRASLVCLVLSLTWMTGEGRPGNGYDHNDQESHRVHVLDPQMELGNIDNVSVLRRYPNYRVSQKNVV